MRQEFYSNGKLLLTGEYAVLDGAKALALPTTFGQFLTVEPSKNKGLFWRSLDKEGKVWFEMEVDLGTMHIRTSTHTSNANTALKILIEAQRLQPDFLTHEGGYDLSTQLTFPKDWGLGSSSTLINNIAQWAKIDPYKLLATTFGGSGYDIACAQHNTPITYQWVQGAPIVEAVEFNPEFNNELYFVYLKKKQNSRDGILQYRKQTFNKNELIQVIGNLTSKIMASKDIDSFETLLNLHETVISNTIRIPTIKEQLFSEYPRAIKSLGAWGGDFILVIGDDASMGYFRQRGYETIIPFSEMILKKKS
ncbi:MAG: GYDIA family GHMP kinase [Maribacter sp.]|uniref:GYDIA family GHMP kinase n=1 Tax=Maribacter sp. TaxID=1897614 RepID=UPI003C70BF73